MSEEKGAVPNIRDLLHPRRSDDKKGVLEALIHSDQHNPTKSRIPDPYGMTVFQALGAWGSTGEKFKVTVQGKEQVFERSVKGLTELFKMYFDENAISYKGESRGEYVTSSLGYFLQDIEDIERSKQSRLEEGDKKKGK